MYRKDILHGQNAIRIRLFASAREAAGTEELLLSLPAGQSSLSARDLRKKLVDDVSLPLKGITFVLAINYRVIPDNSDVTVTCRDEVAVIPPISGG